MSTRARIRKTGTVAEVAHDVQAGERTTPDGRPLPAGWKRTTWSHRPDAEHYEHDTARTDSRKGAVPAFVISHHDGKSYRWEGPRNTFAMFCSDAIEAMNECIPGNERILDAGQRAELLTEPTGATTGETDAD